jgi:hypothetical protein
MYVQKYRKISVTLGIRRGGFFAVALNAVFGRMALFFLHLQQSLRKKCLLLMGGGQPPARLACWINPVSGTFSKLCS